MTLGVVETAVVVVCAALLSAADLRARLDQRIE